MSDGDTSELVQTISCEQNYTFLFNYFSKTEPQYSIQEVPRCFHSRFSNVYPPLGYELIIIIIYPSCHKSVKTVELKKLICNLQFSLCLLLNQYPYKHLITHLRFFVLF